MKHGALEIWVLLQSYLGAGGEDVDVGVGCEVLLGLGAGAVACVEGCVGVVCGYVVEKLV